MHDAFPKAAKRGESNASNLSDGSDDAYKVLSVIITIILHLIVCTSFSNCSAQFHFSDYGSS